MLRPPVLISIVDWQLSWMRHIGVDAHRDYAYVAELLEGDEVKEYRVELDANGVKDLQERLGPDAHVVVEASTSTFRLHDILVPFAAEVLVAHPSQTRGATAFHVKTDRGDALGLARLLKAGFIQRVWVPSRDLRALRNLTEYRHVVTVQRASMAQRMKSMLAQEMMTAPVATLTGPRGRQFLKELELGPGLDTCLASQLMLYDAATKEIERIDEYLRVWCAGSEDAQLLLTIPGVGPVIAACLQAHIGDVSRFAGPDQLAAYAGLVPRVHQSGATLRTGRISHAGSPLMRWALCLAVTHVVHREGAMKVFYERLRERRPKGVVRVACARKLLTMIWYMLKRRDPYNAQDEALTARKKKALSVVTCAACSSPATM